MEISSEKIIKLNELITQLKVKPSKPLCLDFIYSVIFRAKRLACCLVAYSFFLVFILQPKKLVILSLTY